MLKLVEAEVLVTVRRRVLAHIDENGHLVNIEENIEDVEEMDIELEQVIGKVEDDPEIEDPREIE